MIDRQPMEALLYDRPRRKSVAGGEWRITVELVDGSGVVAGVEETYRLADSYLNSYMPEAGRLFVLWLDEQARNVTRRKPKRATRRR